jgi:FkbM family methyltransferase
MTEIKLPFAVRCETALESWRINTFYSKEPETIKWIESFAPGSMFLDVGANIGLYSMYAAYGGANVWALEPHHGNFMAFMQNKRRNRHLNITPLNACAGNRCDIVEFSCDTVEAGSTGGGHTKHLEKTQTVAMFSIDALNNLVGGGPFRHIKIDVDGEEDSIVEGMSESLADKVFESCLIEVPILEFEPRDYIVEAFETNGYTRNNIYNHAVPHSRERRKKEGINVENIIFTRC